MYHVLLTASIKYRFHITVTKKYKILSFQFFLFFFKVMACSGLGSKVVVFIHIMKDTASIEKKKLGIEEMTWKPKHLELKRGLILIGQSSITFIHQSCKKSKTSWLRNTKDEDEMIRYRLESTVSSLQLFQVFFTMSRAGAKEKRRVPAKNAKSNIREKKSAWSAK